MKKLFTLILFFTTVVVNAQDVIDLKKLYDKQVPSTANYTVSDNSIDFKNIDHKGTYYVRFVGQYPKRLLIKNFVGGKAILEGGITSASDNKTLQIADCKNFVLDLTNGKITTNAGSSGVGGQSIYVYGKYKNITIIGGEFNQTSNSGGANLQFESYSDPAFSHGTVVIKGAHGIRSTGEFLYVGYNQPTKAYFDSLIVIECVTDWSRRDGFQSTNVRWTYYDSNKANMIGQEQNYDHVSGFSLNGNNNIVILKNNTVENAHQMLYTGPKTNATLIGNVYHKGNHGGSKAINQALYLKAGQYILHSNVIDAPTAAEAAITIDGGAVTLIAETNTITAKKVYRSFNGGTVSTFYPPPIVVISEGQIKIVTTTTWEGVKTVRYFLGETELIVKP